MTVVCKEVCEIRKRKIHRMCSAQCQKRKRDCDKDRTREGKGDRQ